MGVVQCSQILIKSLKSKPVLNAVRVISTEEQELRGRGVVPLATGVGSVGATSFLPLLKR